MSNRRALSNAVKESKQPKQLSKPKDIDYNSQMGYRDDSPFRNKSSIDINTPTGSIDMSNTGIPLMANGKYLPPYSGTHQFDTNVVREVPLTQAKKGGGLKSKKYSRSLQATNKFFRENPLFEKPKKLSKKRIYDPNARYYEMGGENDCPEGYEKDENGNCVWHDPAQENSIIDKSAIHPVEYSRSQLTMGDPFYNTHTVALNDKNQATWQAKNEDQIKTNLRNTTLKNFIQRHPEESTGLELGYLHNNIWTTPTLGLEKGVEDPTDPGYAPNQLSFERSGKHPNVYFIKNPVEGSAEAPSRTYAKAFQDYVNKDLSKDNAYNKASNDIGKQLLKKGYKGENMWGKNDSDQLYQLYGTEGSTLKGATEITPETLKYLQSIKDSKEGKRHLAKLAGISENDPDYADMLMHYNTTPIDVYAETARPENNDLIRTEEEIPEEQTFLRNTEGPVNYKKGGLTQYAPGGASADPPDWLTKRGANVYFNPAYQNNFTGGVNTNESYFNNLPVFKQDPAAVFGIQGSLSKNRNAKKEAGKGWLYDAYVGMPYSQVIGDNAQYKPSAGIKFDYENAPQDKKFRPHAEVALDYNMHTGPLASISGGARFPITPWGNKQVKPGYGVGHVDVYGGFSGGAGAKGGSGAINYGSRIQGKYQPRWLDRLSRGSYFYGDAGIQFDPVKGKNVQKQTTQEWTGGQDQVTGEFQQMETQGKDPGTKWGATVYANAGVKKDIDDIKFKKNDRAKKIQDIEEREREVEYQNYKQEKPEEKKLEKECPEGERRDCENCPCEPIEKHKHPRWLQDGGEQDGMNGMMKARLAYANEFGNPAAKRMINIPDNPYQFENGDLGTHYMSSMDNYAVPQIQDENGQLMLGDYGPDSREAMRFDSDEDANYFAEHYKDVSPGFIELELSPEEIEEYAKGGYIVEDISVPELNTYAEGGTPDYQLGDEIDEATMKRLKKLGYTFEKI